MPRRSRSRSRSSSPRRSRSHRSRSGSHNKSPRQSRSRSGSRDRHVSPSDIGYRIHVGDLVPDTSERELRKTFEKYGPLLEVWFARRPPCYAFVVFKEKEDAEEAVRDTDGKYICGVRARVSHAKPRVRGGRRNMFGYGGDSPPRHSERGGNGSLRCFTCGDTGHFARDCYQVNRGRYNSRSRSRSRSKSRSRSNERSRRDRSERSHERRRRSPSTERNEEENGSASKVARHSERSKRSADDRGSSSRRNRSSSERQEPVAAPQQDGGNGDEAFD